MSQLIVIGFDADADAFALRQELGAAQKEYLLKLEDAVVVTRPTEGEYQLHQALNLTVAGASRTAVEAVERAGGRITLTRPVRERAESGAEASAE